MVTKYNQQTLMILSDCGILYFEYLCHLSLTFFERIPQNPLRLIFNLASGATSDERLPEKTPSR